MSISSEQERAESPGPSISQDSGISDELKNKIIDRLNVPQKPTRDQIKEQQKAYYESHKEEIREILKVME